MHFSPQEESRIADLASSIEAGTGVQILAAVVGKSDAYPEAPWKAFALAASISALVLAIRAVLDPSWIAPSDMATGAAAVLGFGAAAALLTTLIPSFARRFLPAARLDVEVDQYARALFLEREVFATRERKGILLFVSLFERRVVILPDTGVTARLDESAMRQVVEGMVPLLRRGDRFRALVEGLTTLEAALGRAGFVGTPGAPDEIPDELVQERGAEE